MPSLSSWKTTCSSWACSVVTRSIVREFLLPEKMNSVCSFNRSFCVPEIQSVSTVNSPLSFPLFALTIFRWRMLPILWASSFLIA